MPSAEIGNVEISGNKAGMAYGGFIYSLNINIGSSATPTKLSISVVHKQGINDKTRKNLQKDIDDLNEIAIKIGDLEAISMFLTAYQIRKSVGSHLMTLEYTDGSILLDKIQVCLTERQYAKENQNTLLGKDTEGSIKDEESKFSLDPICDSCDGSGEMINKSTHSAFETPQTQDTCDDAGKLDTIDTEFVNGKCNFSVKRKVKYASDFSDSANQYPFFFVPSDAHTIQKHGGLLVIGRENFVENNCDVPDVDYTFSDLLMAFGVDTGSLSLPNSKRGNTQYITVKNNSLKDRTLGSDGYSSYRRSYSGSLREVLNSWCSDFGYSFTWDIFSSSPQIIGIDLTKTVGGSKINDIKELVDSIKIDDVKNNDAVVESTTESYSKEGSYKQSYISQYLKPAKTKNKTSKKYVKKLFYNVPIEMITSDGREISQQNSTFNKEYTTREWGGRARRDFINSVCIGKYNKEARLSYLWNVAVSSGNSKRVKGCFTALGYSDVDNLDSDVKNAIIAEWTEDQVHDIITRFGEDFIMKLGYFNEQASSYWEGWDESVSDFIGKYYFKPIVDGELDEKGLVTKAAFENVTRMVAGNGEVRAYPFRKGKENQDAANFPWANHVKAGESHWLHLVFPYLRSREIGSGVNQGKSQQGMPTDDNGQADFFKENSSGQLTRNPKYNPSSAHYQNENTTYENGIWAFERDSKWGTTQEEAEAFFTTESGSNMAENFVAKNIPLEGRALMIFQDYLKKNNRDPMAAQIDSNISPVLIVGPPPGKGIKVSANVGGTSINGYTAIENANAVFSRNYYPSTFANFNEHVSHSISDLGSGGNRGTENNTKGGTLCETSTIEELCGICGFEDESNKPYTGFPYWQYNKVIDDPNSEDVRDTLLIPSGTICEAFSIPKIGTEMNSARWRFLRIVLPCQLDYVGYLEINYNSRQTIEGVSKVFGSPLPPKVNGEYINNTLGIKLIENNITSDADSSLFDDDQERILNIFVPDGFDPNTGLPTSKGITAEKYHNEIKKYFDASNLGIDLPRQQFSFSIAGLNFSGIKGGGTDSLQSLLRPDKGWSSMAVTYSDSGITTNLSFETRPAVLANPQIFMKHLGPKLNTFR